jgi:ribonuclease BN (tRNA processing enzyme)
MRYFEPICWQAFVIVLYVKQISLLVVGCGDAFASGGNGNTCFHISSQATNTLVDCGATALLGLKKLGLSSNDVDHIILTHFHGDHFGGMPFVMLDATRLKRDKPLHIISPPGGRKRIEDLFNMFYPGSTAAIKGLDIRYYEYSGHDRIECNGILVETFPVVHSKDTLPHGIRITIDDILIAYTGDTEWTETIIDIVAGADLAICECTFFRKEEKNHLNYKALLSRLPDLTCKKLLLTHFDDEMLENLDKIKPACARDGKRITLVR